MGLLGMEEERGFGGVPWPKIRQSPCYRFQSLAMRNRHQ